MEDGRIVIFSVCIASRIFYPAIQCSAMFIVFSDVAFLLHKGALNFDEFSTRDEPDQLLALLPDFSRYFPIADYGTPFNLLSRVIFIETFQ
uniref:Uncharacterized protein n=1 Tax=Oryza brachyantha TaxID=4533 RepID=J3LNY7_ORYBR